MSSTGSIIGKSITGAIDFVGRNTLLSNKRLVLMLLIALTLRLALFLGMKPWNREGYERKIITLDALKYHELATNLVTQQEFKRSNQPELTYTPIYPLFVALVYFLFGYQAYIVILIHILLGATNCLLTYKLGTIMFDEKVGIVAGYLLTFEYVSIMFEQLLYSDILFTFLFLMAIYFVLRFMKTAHKNYLAYSGIFLGVAALCRPIGLYYPFILGLLLIFGCLRKREKFIKRLSNGIIMMLFFCLTISPWLIRNYLVFGPPLMFSSIQGRNMRWNVAFLEQAQTGVGFNTAFKRVSEEFKDLAKDKHLSPPQIARQQEQFALKKILADPLTYARVHLMGILPLFLSHGKNIFSYLLELKGGGWIQERHQLHSISAFFKREVLPSFQSIINSRNQLLRLFFLFAIALFVLFYAMVITGSAMIWQVEKSALWLPLTIISYFSVVSAPVSTIRFRIPFMPYMMILAAYAIVGLWSKYKKPAATH